MTFENELKHLALQVNISVHAYWVTLVCIIEIFIL